MTSARLWDCAAIIEVDGKKAGPFQLDQSNAVTIGRSDRAGLRSPSPRLEVPRELARLKCTRSGWLLENEGFTVGGTPKPVRITGPDIKSRNGAVFASHAWVLLSRGNWTLKWDVGVTVTVTLTPLSKDSVDMQRAADQPRRSSGMFTVAPEPVRLTALERRNMAALFAYIIRNETMPKEIFAEAARLLGGDAEARKGNRALIKAQLPKVTKRINRMRAHGDALSSHEEIGYYLVDVSGTLSSDDFEY
ncbi:hypothetical protein BH09ACT6_BH09ACT6_15470 [soil metagenome]